MVALRWKRTLIFTAIAQMFCIMGFSFVTPFIPLYIQHLGVHGVEQITLWAAILSGGTSICMAIAAPIWGVLADRHGRKVMLVRAAFSAAILIGLMGLAQNVWHLLILRIIQGWLTGTVTAAQALIAAQSPKDRLGSSMGIMQTAVFVGTSLGPLAGGVVADAIGFRLSFVFGGGLLFLAGILVVLFVEEDKRFIERSDAPKTPFFRGMREAAMAPALLAMVGAIFAVNFGQTVVFPILPQFVQVLQGAAGHAATVTGFILAAAGIAGAAASLTSGFLGDRLGYKRVLVVGAALAAVLSIPQFFVTHTWQMFALRVGIGLSMGAVMPSATALIASLVPPEKRGTAYGLTGSANALGFSAGPMTAALVVGISGIRTVFLTAAVVLGFIALWVALMVHVPQAQLEVAEEEVAEQRIQRTAGA